MIYGEKTVGMPVVLRKEGDEKIVWSLVPGGEVGESIDGFQVIEQDGQLYFFSCGRHSDCKWYGKKITQKEFDWIQNEATEKQLWYFTQP